MLVSCCGMSRCVGGVIMFKKLKESSACTDVTVPERVPFYNFYSTGSLI